ncbi:MAG TPA: hypothetical protein VJ992_13950 [Gemmatimonadales bacterium]|nr:hypothetical protein [Gemmatimonadales bacterium]
MIPAWVIFAANGAIALGTVFGGWRIVHTMGSRLTIPVAGGLGSIAYLAFHALLR